MANRFGRGMALLLALSAPVTVGVGVGAVQAQDTQPGLEEGSTIAAGDNADARATRIWDCVSGAVSYEVTVAPDADAAQVDVRVGDAANAPPIRTYEIGILAPFPRFDFSDGDNRFYATATGASFVSAGEDPIMCTERTLLPPEPGPDGRLDIAGASLGGRLRSGPGTQFAPLGTLDPGTPLIIVAGTEIVLNDYLWWEVEVEGTRVFLWGGVLCAADRDLIGLAGACGAPVEDLAEGVVLRSRGGNVRSGPGTRFDEIGTIAPGEAITALSDTGVTLNDAPWYEIAFEGASGYHWGGLICAEGATQDLAFPAC